MEYQQPRRKSRILLCKTFCAVTEPTEGIKWQKTLTPKLTLPSEVFSLPQLISSVFKLFPLMDYLTFPSTRFTLKISNWQSSHTSLQCKHFSDWWLFWVPLFFVALFHHSQKSCINNHTWLENTVTLFKCAVIVTIHLAKCESLRFQQHRIIALLISARVSILHLFTAQVEKEWKLVNSSWKITQMKTEPFKLWTLLRRGRIFLSSAFHWSSKLWTEKCEVPVIDTDLFQRNLSSSPSTCFLHNTRTQIQHRFKRCRARSMC